MVREETTLNNRQRVVHSSTRRRLNQLSTSHSPSIPRRPRPTPKPVEVFHKCHSESTIVIPPFGDECRSLESEEGGWFGRVNTLDDILVSIDTSSDIIASSLLTRINTQGYQKEAKVVITVTVEGSPGPIKTLVKLGANVEDTIKLVVLKYVQEGRSPLLDKDAASFFDLYVSYFSLQSLERTYTIGDVGTRSFYLRKSRKNSNGCNMLDVTATSLTSCSEYEHIQARSSPSKHPSLPMVVLSPFMARKLNKFVRRVHKLFILLGCLHSR